MRSLCSGSALQSSGIRYCRASLCRDERYKFLVSYRSFTTQHGEFCCFLRR